MCSIVCVCKYLVLDKLDVTEIIKCDSCCCFSCLFCNHALDVYVDGNYIGTVKQRFSFWRPVFSIYSEDGEEIATLKAPCCPCRCSFHMQIEIISLQGESNSSFGDIRKVHSPSEAFNSDHETFTLEFGKNSLTTKSKILWLAASCLMNLMYFEVS
ncbi:hypothetical protein EB796_002032 [Bugula neritina]|uniref:Phospholipid scramblase n=1 Tax=Bugula neritina TaxID=10212 RepID=A0A7J7KNB4_BUGNE|nr:hypothetical protein EB796_002032 [Bugula neritina]